MAASFLDRGVSTLDRMVMLSGDGNQLAVSAIVPGFRRLDAQVAGKPLAENWGAPIFVDAKLLSLVLNAMSSAVVALGWSENRLTVKGEALSDGSGADRVTLLAMQDNGRSSEFTGQDDVTHAFAMDAGVFSNMIRVADASRASDQNRESLRHFEFNIDPKSGHLTIVALDGYRLSQLSAACDLPASGEAETFLAPGDELARLVTYKLTGDLKFGQQKVGMTPGHFLVSGALLDDVLFCLTTVISSAKYPNYTSVMPSGKHEKMTVDAGALSAHLKVAVPFLNDTHASDLLLLKENLRIDVENTELGHYRSVCPLLAPSTQEENETLKISMNLRWLLNEIQVMRSAGLSELGLEYYAANKPMVVRATGNAMSAYVLIMPMNPDRR